MGILICKRIMSSQTDFKYTLLNNEGAMPYTSIDIKHFPTSDRPGMVLCYHADQSVEEVVFTINEDVFQASKFTMTPFTTDDDKHLLEISFMQTDIVATFVWGEEKEHSLSEEIIDLSSIMQLETVQC